MSYDLTLTKKPGTSSLTHDAFDAWVKTTPHWETYGTGDGAYDDPSSGADFSVRVDGDAPDLTLVLTMSGNANHVAGLDLVRAVRQLVDRFELQVNDPQMEGMGQGPLDEAKLLSGWNFYNGFATKTTHQLLGQAVPPHMPAAKLEATVAWNRARAAAEDAGETRDDWFVPRISYLRAEDGTAGSYVAWVGGQGYLPVVDVIVTPLGQLRWEAITEALDGAARAEAPAPNYRIDGATAAKLDAVIAASDKIPGLPDGINARSVRTTEVVQPYLGGILAATDAEALTSAAVLAHQTDDRKKAFAVARRLLEVDPDSHAGALVGAINGFYLAEYEEAMRCADAALRISPEDRTVHIVRCGLLTDLARYDEAIAEADQALADDPRDAMTVNMKAYALAAANRNDEAKAAYEEALSLIDAELAESPDEGDVVSRRAWALLGLERAADAELAATRALELVSDPFLTLQSLGRARILRGQYDAAVEALDQAIAAREAAPMASYYRALALAKSDRREAARAALASAVRAPHFRSLASQEPLLAALL